MNSSLRQRQKVVDQDQYIFARPTYGRRAKAEGIPDRGETKDARSRHQGMPRAETP